MHDRLALCLGTDLTALLREMQDVPRAIVFDDLRVIDRDVSRSLLEIVYRIIPRSPVDRLR